MSTKIIASISQGITKEPRAIRVEQKKHNNWRSVPLEANEYCCRFVVNVYKGNPSASLWMNYYGKFSRQHRRTIWGGSKDDRNWNPEKRVGLNTLTCIKLNKLHQLYNLAYFLPNHDKTDILDTGSTGTHLKPTSPHVNVTTN